MFKNLGSGLTPEQEEIPHFRGGGGLAVPCTRLTEIGSEGTDLDNEILNLCIS
jgi:hypothetical protein